MTENSKYVSAEEAVKARLAEIRSRVDAATDGPWAEKRSGQNHLTAGIIFGTRLDGTKLVQVADMRAAWNRKENVNFIAHSRDDVPWLLNEIERLRSLPAVPQTNELQKLLDEQAEDEGLWFVAQTMPEAYLQQELRRLHAAIESSAAVPQEEGPK